MIKKTTINLLIIICTASVAYSQQPSVPAKVLNAKQEAIVPIAAYAAKGEAIVICNKAVFIRKLKNDFFLIFYQNAFHQSSLN